MALSKKEETRISSRVFGCLSLIVAVVLFVVGVLCWKTGNGVVSEVNKSLAAGKVYFPPAGSPGFDANAFPAAQKYAGQQVDDGLKAKAFAEDLIGVQLKMLGANKTTAEVSALAAADPQNIALQQQQAAMFQLDTTKTLLLASGYGTWSQGKMIQNVGAVALIGGVVLLAAAGWHMMRYKRLQ
jgi:hypothetical protein